MPRKALFYLSQAVGYEEFVPLFFMQSLVLSCSWYVRKKCHCACESYFCKVIQVSSYIVAVLCLLYFSRNVRNRQLQGQCSQWGQGLLVSRSTD